MLAKSLPQLRAEVRSRTEKKNALLWLPDWELNGFLRGSYTELYDKITTVYEDYNINPNPFVVQVISGQRAYPGPLDFFKSRGMEVQLAGSAGFQWCSIGQFPFEERNLFNFYPLAWNIYGFPNVRYRHMGAPGQQGEIWFIPVATIAASAQMWYVPTCPILVDTLPAATWGASATHALGDLIVVSVSGIAGYATAQSCVFECVVPGITGSTIPAFNVPGTTTDNTAVWSYAGLLSQYSTVLDGVSGWEEYVILDACIKVRNKERVDASLFQAQLSKLEKRIQDTAPNRDAGAPQRIVDIHRMNAGPMGGTAGEDIY